jgi:hypothetical protein
MGFEYEIKGSQGIPMAYTVQDFGITTRYHFGISRIRI